MRHFAGLDVGHRRTSICVLDNDGATIKEIAVDTDPSEIAKALRGVTRKYIRVGLEAGAIAESLYAALASHGIPVICIEARHAHAILKENLNKTDKNDARGIANLMRMGVFRVVHIKSAASRRLKTLIGARRLLLGKAIDLENGIKGFLVALGLKVPRVGARHFDATVRAIIGKQLNILDLIDPLLRVRTGIREQYAVLDAALQAAAQADPVCRLFMTVPGVGPVAATTYRAAIDIPTRFSRSRTVGAHLGLTPRTRQSGETERRGRISKRGDRGLRTALFAAAKSILGPRIRDNELRTWGMKVQARRGRKRASVAVARRLAVVLHHLWMESLGHDKGAAIA